MGMFGMGSYEELLNFVKEFDHAPVPDKFPHNAQLGI